MMKSGNYKIKEKGKKDQEGGNSGFNVFGPALMLKHDTTRHNIRKMGTILMDFFFHHFPAGNSYHPRSAMPEMYTLEDRMEYPWQILYGDIML